MHCLIVFSGPYTPCIPLIHVVLIRSTSPPTPCSPEKEFLGFVTDRALLSYFAFSSRRPPSLSLSTKINNPVPLSLSPDASVITGTPFPNTVSYRHHSRFLQNALATLSLPGLSLRSAVVACPSSATVLDAMSRMSSMGVSSVAVIEDSKFASGRTGEMKLLSAVSVTDIGKV